MTPIYSFAGRFFFIYIIFAIFAPVIYPRFLPLIFLKIWRIRQPFLLVRYRHTHTHTHTQSIYVYMCSGAMTGAHVSDWLTDSLTLGDFCDPQHVPVAQPCLCQATLVAVLECVDKRV